MSTMILWVVNLNVSVIQGLSSFDKQTISLNNVPACVLTRHSSFFWWSDKVSYAGGQRHDLKMTDDMSFLAIESCSNSHVLEFTFNEWGQTGGSSVMNKVLMIQRCVILSIFIFSAAVWWNTQRASNWQKVFWLYVAHFRTIDCCFSLKKASPIMSPAHIVEKPGLFLCRRWAIFNVIYKV